MGKQAQKIGKGIRKWQKDFMEKFRLSLSVRISLNYLRFLLINGVLFFAILTFLYLQGNRKELKQVADQMIVCMESGNSAFRDYIEEAKPKQVAVTIVAQGENPKEHLLYSGLEEDIMALHYSFDYFHLERRNKEWKLFVREPETVFYDRVEYMAYFYYDFSATVEKMLYFLRNAGFVYVFLMLFIVLESRQDNRRIFRPIRELTETAKRLTINNLHSERLPIRGMTTELRDLAEVFNEMLDRLELSYESQKQFVSNASHELRTPIAVIQGYSGMLARWGADDPDILKESIEAIESESKSMKELVEKLLFLSRHDKKTLKLQKQLFSMGEVVEDMVKETRMVTSGREIKTQVIQNVKVYGDAQLLKQAVRVFIDNAVKYSAEGDSVTIACEDRFGSCVITVADTGIGMKKEDVNHMFDRFFRSDDVRDRKIEGHGLGLSIARLIILAHAGTIKVRTQYTKGTSITITIPKQRKLLGSGCRRKGRQYMNCRQCPRNCGALREENRPETFGYCGVPYFPKVARAALHFWEEPCISGEEGSGTVFFSGCNLQCVYCQNQNIAKGRNGKAITIERLSELFLELQEKGANNINLVTPSHYYPQIKQALSIVKNELHIPVLSNTSSYESVKALREMEGCLDIFLADYKYESAELAKKYSHAADYPQVAKKALNEMFRQVGEPVFDERGMMKKGMIIRHLLLPGCLEDSKAAIGYLYETFGDSVYLSIMNQYTPLPYVAEYPELNRKVTEEEYDELIDFALELGVENAFVQEGETAEESFIPEFDGEGV